MRRALRKEVSTGYRKLFNEALHDFQSSPNILRVSKSRSTKWAEHVSGGRGAKRNTYRVSLGKPERKGHLEDLSIGGRET
jgi:hypothetical protein